MQRNAALEMQSMWIKFPNWDQHKACGGGWAGKSRGKIRGKSMESRGKIEGQSGKEGALESESQSESESGAGQVRDWGQFSSAANILSKLRQRMEKNIHTYSYIQKWEN